MARVVFFPINPVFYIKRKLHICIRVWHNLGHFTLFIKPLRLSIRLTLAYVWIVFYSWSSRMPAQYDVNLTECLMTSQYWNINNSKNVSIEDHGIWGFFRFQWCCFWNQEITWNISKGKICILLLFWFNICGYKCSKQDGFRGQIYSWDYLFLLGRLHPADLEVQAVRAVILGRGCHLPDPLCCGHNVLWSVLPFQESMVHKHYPQVRRVPVADILYERCTYFRDYFLPGDFKLGFHEEQLQISTVSRSKEGRANAS